MRGCGGCRKVLLEAFLGSTARTVHSEHSFTQLGLMMLHHMKNALYVGVDRMAGACRLCEQKGDTTQYFHDAKLQLSLRTNLPFQLERGFFRSLGGLLMLARSVWRFSEVKERFHHDYIQTILSHQQNTDNYSAVSRLKSTLVVFFFFVFGLISSVACADNRRLLSSSLWSCGTVITQTLGNKVLKKHFDGERLFRHYHFNNG